MSKLIEVVAVCVTWPFRLLWAYVALGHAFVRYVVIEEVLIFFREIDNRVNPDGKIQPRCSSGRHERYRSKQ